MKEEKMKCKKCNKIFVISNPKKEGIVICPYCKATMYHYVQVWPSKNSLKGDNEDNSFWVDSSVIPYLESFS